VSESGWQRMLVTLRDAATSTTGLSKKESGPTRVASRYRSDDTVGGAWGPTMSARVAVIQALNRHIARVFNPDHKDHHWDRPKLARDR
jgi:hypothetical protein